MFALFDQIVSMNICNSVGFILLLILEALIFVNTLEEFLKAQNSEFSDSFYSYLKYINPASLMDIATTKMYIYVAFICFGFLFTLLFFLLLFLHFNFGSNMKQSLVYSYALRISGLTLLIIKHILFQPFIAVLFNTFTCGSSDDDMGYECQSQIHIIIAILSSLVFFFFLILSVLSIIFYVDEQPDSKLPWAYCSRLLEVYKMGNKIIVAFAAYLATKQSGIGAIALGVSLTMSFLCLYQLQKQTQMNDPHSLYSLIVCESLIAWMSFITFAAVLTDLWLGNPLVIVVMIGLVIFLIVFCSKRRSQALILTTHISAFKSIEDLEIYCRIVLEIVAKSKKTEDLVLEGMISVHAASCNTPYCPCQEIIPKPEKLLEGQENNEDISNKEAEESPNNQSEASPRKVAKKRFSQMEIFKKNDENDNTVENEVSANERKLFAFAKLIIAEITRWGEKQENQARLHIYLSYLKLYSYKNKLAALYEIMCALDSNPNAYEQFLAFRLKNRIEEEIIRKESRVDTSNEIDNLISFQRVLAEMQECMQETYKLYIGFWKELLDESPNYQYLGDVSHEISRNALKIRKSYRSLIELNPLNIYCRMLYALFLKKIIKDEFDAYDIHEDINRANNNIRLHSAYDNKFGANSKTALFIISGNKGDIGEILGINNEVSELFSYEKAELLGHNIAKIMPPLIAAKHSQMIRNYFCSRSEVPTMDRMVLPLHKMGYIVPCSFLQRIVPNLGSGLHFIGFLQKITEFSEYCPMLEKNTSSEDVLVLLADQAWALQAFNLKAARFFGIEPEQANLRKYIVSEEKISMLQLIPQLIEESQTYHNADYSFVTLNLAYIRKVIDTEIEILGSGMKKEDNTGTSLFSSVGKDSAIPYDDSIRGSLTIIDLVYGKYCAEREAEVLLKLVVIYLEQGLMEKGSIKMNESTLQCSIQQNKKKEDFLMEEVCSQSQSSNSSQSNTEMAQRNIRSFKERIKEQESPFFVRCFIKLGVMTFLLVLASAIFEYVFITMSIRFVKKSFKNALLVHKRFNVYLNIPMSFRTIYDIHQSFETASSEIYLDRISTYAQIISQELEELREMTNTINKMSHAFSREHLALLERPYIQFTELPDPSAVHQVSQVTNHTLAVAVTKYVAKATELKRYDTAQLRNTTTENEEVALNRLMGFIITNAKGTLTYYILKTKNMFYDEVRDEIEYYESITLLILIIDPIVIVIIMLLFVPFILNVQSSLLRIYVHLSKFKDSDIRKWLEICNTSGAELKASITEIKRIFATESFDILSPEALEEENKEQRKKEMARQKKKEDEDKPTQETLLQTTEKGTESREQKTEENDENEPMIFVKEEVVFERKQKMFAQMTREKTKKYLIYLLLFGLFIGVFRSFDGMSFNALYSDSDLNLNLHQAFSEREHRLLLSMFFFRENLRDNVLNSLFEIPDATKEYVQKAFDSEVEISRTRSKLTGSLKDLQEFLNEIDSNLYCSTFLSNEPGCSTVYKGLLKLGFNAMVMSTLSYVKKVHERFLVEYLRAPFYATAQLKSKEMVKMNDLRNKYGRQTFNGIFNEFTKIVDRWVDELTLKHDLKFGGYITLLVFIFLFLWKKMVTNMKMDIIKALGILNVLPTNHLRSNPDFIKEMNQSSLIN